MDHDCETAALLTCQISVLNCTSASALDMRCHFADTIESIQTADHRVWRLRMVIPSTFFTPSVAPLPGPDGCCAEYLALYDLADMLLDSMTEASVVRNVALPYPACTELYYNDIAFARFHCDRRSVYPADLPVSKLRAIWAIWSASTHYDLTNRHTACNCMSRDVIELLLHSPLRPAKDERHFSSDALPDSDAAAETYSDSDDEDLSSSQQLLSETIAGYQEELSEMSTDNEDEGDSSQYTDCDEAVDDPEDQSAALTDTDYEE